MIAWSRGRLVQALHLLQSPSCSLRWLTVLLQTDLGSADQEGQVIGACVAELQPGVSGWLLGALYFPASWVQYELQGWRGPGGRSQQS